MKKTEELIEKLNGLEIKTSHYSSFTEFTKEKIETYKNGGLLPNECRTNSQPIARLLGNDSKVVEGVVITPNLLCFKHMWVKKDGVHIDLTLEIFGQHSEENRYFELTDYNSTEYAYPKELQFSDKTQQIIETFYKEYPDSEEEYLELKNKLNS